MKPNNAAYMLSVLKSKHRNDKAVAVPQIIKQELNSQSRLIHGLSDKYPIIMRPAVFTIPMTESKRLEFSIDIPIIEAKSAKQRYGT